MILMVMSGLVLLWGCLSTASFLAMTYDEFLKSAYPSADVNPWFGYYFNTGFFWFLTFFLPLVISLVVFFIKNIEDRADGWKRMLVLPFSPFRLYINKLLVIWICTIGFILSLFAFFIASGVMLSWLKPEFKFDQFPTYHYFLICFALKYCAFGLTVSSFCYLILLLIKRYALSLATVVLLPIVAPLTFDSKFNPFYSFISTMFNFMRFRSRYISDSEFDANKEALMTYPMFTSLDVVNTITLLTIITLLYFVSKKLLIAHE